MKDLTKPEIRVLTLLQLDLETKEGEAKQPLETPTVEHLGVYASTQSTPATIASMLVEDLTTPNTSGTPLQEIATVATSMD